MGRSPWSTRVREKSACLTFRATRARPGAGPFWAEWAEVFAWLSQVLVRNLNFFRFWRKNSDLIPISSKIGIRILIPVLVLHMHRFTRMQMWNSEFSNLKKFDFWPTIGPKIPFLGARAGEAQSPGPGQKWPTSCLGQNLTGAGLQAWAATRNSTFPR